MPVDKNLSNDIAGEIARSNKILVVSHIRPDGDAVGSVLGFGLSLQAAGKDVQMVLADGVPTSFRYLKGSDQIRNRPDGECDLVCVLDSSDLQRVGSALNGYKTPDLNIDHHITNLNFARLNLVDAKAAATSQILSELLPAIGLPVTAPAADALMTGMIADTLGFRTSNMTPAILRLSADLMEGGADLPELYRLALSRRSFEAAKYWGCGLSNLERQDRLIWTTLTMADRKMVGYSGRDDADLVNMLSSIDDADIAVMFVEQNDDWVKVSWRSQPGFDVSQLALIFGGGGHPAASGAEILGGLEEVIDKVLEVTRVYLRKKASELREV